MKFKQFYIINLAITLFFFSCKQGDDINNEQSEFITENAVDNHLAFAKILAKASQHEGVRSLIKKEALKKFDKDYDVLVHVIKNEMVEEENTFYDVLKSYDTKDELDNILNSTPLLTIYIPKVPEFDAKSWNVSIEEPLIAIAGKNENDAITYMNAEGKSEQMPADHIPAFAVLVVKNNERVSVGDPNAKGKSISKNGFSYTFNNDAFDPSKDYQVVNNKLNFNQPGINSKIKESYPKSKSCANCYQRDYIYYSIDPSNNINEGSIDLRYSEAIRSIKFNNTSGISNVSSNYTEGDLELHFETFFIGANDALNKLEKVITLNLNDVENVTYKKRCNKFLGITLNCWHVVDKRETKLYTFENPLEITPWKMDEYGDRWLFKVFEFDPSTKYTTKVSHSTTIGANFKTKVEGTIKKVVKIGTGLGVDIKTSKSNSKEISYTKESDQLGQFIVNWTDPVITNEIPVLNSRFYITKKYSTGTVSINFGTSYVF